MCPKDTDDPTEKLKRKLLTPENTEKQIANVISDVDGDGRTGVTLYALSTILKWRGHYKTFTFQFCLLQPSSNLNPFTPSKLFHLRSFDRSISNRRVVWLVLSFPCFVETPVFNVNTVDSDQTPRLAASDLGYTICQWPFL